MPTRKWREVFQERTTRKPLHDVDDVGDADDEEPDFPSRNLLERF